MELAAKARMEREEAARKEREEAARKEREEAAKKEREKKAVKGELLEKGKSTPKKELGEVVEKTNVNEKIEKSTAKEDPLPPPPPTPLAVENISTIEEKVKTPAGQEPPEKPSEASVPPQPPEEAPPLPPEAPPPLPPPEEKPPPHAHTHNNYTPMVMGACFSPTPQSSIAYTKLHFETLWYFAPIQDSIHVLTPYRCTHKTDQIFTRFSHGTTSNPV